MGQGTARSCVEIEVSSQTYGKFKGNPQKANAWPTHWATQQKVQQTIQKQQPGQCQRCVLLYSHSICTFHALSSSPTECPLLPSPLQAKKHFIYPGPIDALILLNLVSLYSLVLQIPINRGLRQNTSSYSPLLSCLLQHLSEERKNVALVSTPILTVQSVSSPLP